VEAASSEEQQPLARRKKSELVETVKRKGNLPGHVAIIMDGNGRWAERRGLSRIQGHRAGRRAVREVVEGCIELGIDVLTLYTFSVENWNRPRREVSALMRFLERTLIEERDELKRNGVSLRVIGRVSDLPEGVQKVLRETMGFLEGGNALVLNLALSYGGRAEIADATRRIAADTVAGRVELEEVDEELVERYLYTTGLPDPDLLIRTSGELRISNFLLWQLAYAEIWVTETLWPDFRKKHLFEAVRDYQRRQRRFGRID
jgi:undecaprenyl diphosphate synthase